MWSGMGSAVNASQAARRRSASHAGAPAARASAAAAEIPAAAFSTVAATYPTEPSICTASSRFSSTAYSICSSLTNGSKKPLTMSAVASASEMPREVR